MCPEDACRSQPQKQMSQRRSSPGKHLFPFGLTFLILLFSGAAGTVHAGSWKTLPPAPTARTETAAAFLDGKIYLIGGFTPEGITRKVEAWDLATGRWTERQPLPRALHHTTATAAGGKIYVIGGFAGGLWTPVNTTYEYDPARDRWTEKSPMPTARGALAAGAIDGKIQAVGGAVKKFLHLVNTGANEVYDPATGRWLRLEPVPTPRDHLAVSVTGGKLYAIGGRINVDYHKNLSANEVYDPQTGKWRKLAPLPTARSGITSQVLDGKIFVFGGESEKGTFDENEAYDPETNTWETREPMPKARHGLGSTVSPLGIHLLTGGPNPGGGGSRRHEVYSSNP